MFNQLLAVKRSLAFRPAFVLSVILSLLTSSLAWAGSFVVFPAKTYVRQTGAPVTVTDTFSVRNPNTQFVLQLYNGGLEDDTSEYVTSTTVVINGVTVVAPGDLNQQTASLTRPVTLSATNTISVQVRGKPGGELAIQIVGVDNDPPVITASASPVANAAGWNNSNVTVTFTCSDAISGVAICPTPVNVTAEGSQTVSGTATDFAGNSANASITVKLDKSAPAISASAVPAANADGWNNADVTLSFQCQDALSGVQTCPTAATVSAEGAAQVITRTATDVAGNSAGVSVTLNIDRTSPAIAATQSPLPNANGWNNADVTLSYGCSDALSGVKTCNPPVTISSEGANQPVSAFAVDKAGNQSSIQTIVSLDKTPPTITASQTPAANANGWNNTDVTISFACNDGLSGVDTCASPTTLSAEGPAQNVSGSSMDKAGNSASTSLTVNIDKTAPALTISSPADGSTVSTAALQLTGQATDALSGVAAVTCSGMPANLSSGVFSCNLTLASGVNAIQVQATDNAGNVVTNTLSVMFSAITTLDPPPNMIYVTPDTFTLGLAETRVLSLADDLGRVVPATSWEVSDTTIAAIGADSSITPIAAGTVTVTGHYQQLSAQAQLTIVNSDHLTQDTVRWSVQPLPGNAPLFMKPGTASGPDDANAYTYENTPNGVLVRALTDDGRQLWMHEIVPQTVAGAMLKAGVTGASSARQSATSVGTGIGTGMASDNGNELWRQSIFDGEMGWALHPEGIVFILQADYDHNSQFTLFGKDAVTGQDRFAPILLPVSAGGDCCGGLQPFPGLPSVLPDGNLYLPLEHFVDYFSYDQLDVLKVTPTGQQQWINVAAVPLCGESPLGDVHEVIPDGPDTFLVTWSYRYDQCNRYGRKVQVSRFTTAGGFLRQSELPLGDQQNFLQSYFSDNDGDAVISDTNTGFITDGHTLVGFDTVNGIATSSYVPPDECFYCRNLEIVQAAPNAEVVVKNNPPVLGPSGCAQVSFGLNLVAGFNVGGILECFYDGYDQNPYDLAAFNALKQYFGIVSGGTQFAGQTAQERSMALPEANLAGTTTLNAFGAVMGPTLQLPSGPEWITKAADGNRAAFADSKEVAVISWVDKNDIDLTSVQPISQDLAINLNNDPTDCAAEVGQWALGFRDSISTENDRLYANYFLLKNSSNARPDTNGIANLDAIELAGDFRLFNRFKVSFQRVNDRIVAGSVKPIQKTAAVGRTPDPCGLVAPVAGEAHTDNGSRGVRASSTKVYQLAEGRVGSLGQRVNRTLNWCSSMFCVLITAPDKTPWIYSVINFSIGGNSIDRQIFPTYYWYEDGRFQGSFMPNLDAFIRLNSSSSELLKTQIQ